MLVTPVQDVVPPEGTAGRARDGAEEAAEGDGEGFEDGCLPGAVLADKQRQRWMEREVERFEAAEIL